MAEGNFDYYLHYYLLLLLTQLLSYLQLSKILHFHLERNYEQMNFRKKEIQLFHKLLQKMLVIF